MGAGWVRGSELGLRGRFAASCAGMTLGLSRTWDGDDDCFVCPSGLACEDPWLENVAPLPLSREHLSRMLGDALGVISHTRPGHADLAVVAPVSAVHSMATDEAKG